MKKIILCVFCFFVSTIAKGDSEWIPSQINQININEQIIQTTICPEPKIPTMVYQLTPHVIFEKVSVKHRYVFREFEEVKLVPKTYWIPQYVIIYK